MLAMRPIFILLFSLPAFVFACSCINQYVPLEEEICRTAESNGQVLEVTLTDKLGAGKSIVSVDRVIAGTTARRKFTVQDGNSAMCGFSIEGASRGQRYLLFLYADQENAEVVRLSECGWNKNMYRFDRTGARLEYTTPDEDTGTSGVGYSFQPYRLGSILQSCGLESGKLLGRSPLFDLQLYASPGNGKPRLGVTSGDFPSLSLLSAYSPLGQPLGQVPLVGYMADTPIDLTYLPAGLSFLVVTDGTYRKSFPYVKMGPRQGGPGN